MHLKFFGESHDMAKHDIMQWLVPGGPWKAHPMLFNDRPQHPLDSDFLQQYKAALEVAIIPNEHETGRDRFATSILCQTHLLLDPDTGLRPPGNERNSRKHLTIRQFVNIANSQHRRGLITLVYDQGYTREPGGINIWTQTGAKIQAMRNLSHQKLHAVAYMAHEGTRVRLIWASTDTDLMTQVTTQLQQQSHYPCCRFIDDGCGHVDCPPI